METQADEMLTVIVPCFNEEQSIAQTVGSIARVAPELDLKVELLLVDDGSSDGTSGEMEKLCEQYPFCRMKINQKNLGLGRTVLSCYDQIPRHSWVTVIPGDNEFIFASVKNLLGRPIGAEAVAEAVSFLLTARGICGQTLYVDCGQRFVRREGDVMFEGRVRPDG